MTDRNKLWEKHRVYLPEMREKAIHRCKDCKFFVQIQGKRETRCGCIVNIRTFREGRTVPFSLPVKGVIKLVGLEGLEESIRHNDPDATACGLFEKK